MRTSFLLTQARALFSVKITQTDSSSCSSTGKETEQKSTIPASTVYILDRYSIQVFTIFKLPTSRATGRLRIISRQNFPKRTHVLLIPSEPYSGHSVHSAIGSRMNRIVFRSFRKRNRSQKNTNTTYSVYSYSGIVPKERALTTEKRTLGLHVNILRSWFTYYCANHCSPYRTNRLNI